MTHNVTTASLIVIVAAIVAFLPTCIPADKQDKPNLALPAPSPTWLFSSVTSAATPPLTQVPRSSLEAQTQTTPTFSPEMLRQGQRLFYEVGCFYCHGIKAEGGVGPNIARTGLPLELLIQQVYYPEDEMPAFPSTVVSQSDLAAIYAYLQSLPPTDSRPQIVTNQPDVATGEALYFYFGCFGCHGYQGQGGFGPRIARTKLSFEEVRTQVRNPRQRMPAFGPERISNEELIYIFAFLQNGVPQN